MKHQKDKSGTKNEAGSVIQSVISEKNWLIEEDDLKKFMARIQNADLNRDVFNPELFYGQDEDEEENKKPFVMKNGIAIIDIHGPLIKRARGFFAWLFGITGMVQIGETIQKALNDPDVKGIFLDVDSPGGSVSGTSDLADIVFSARGVKPIMSFADDQATSAAAWISSSADFVAVANESTRLGSVGVVGVHMDFADRAKELGIRPTVFSAGKFKGIGNEFKHLSKDDKKYIQSQFDHIHGLFIDVIVRNTGIQENKLDKDLKEAKVFMGSQGIKVGLAHKIMNRKQAMDLLSDVAEGKTTFEEHKTKMESIKLQGGENDMDEKELKAKNDELAIQLKAAQNLIAEMNTNTEVEGLKTEIEDLTAGKVEIETKLSEAATENETLKADAEAGSETLRTEIETLKADATSKEVFVAAGKSYIEDMKAEIKKTSVKVDGDAYNESLIDAQIKAFGNDVEMLSQFKTSLETRLTAMLKTGDIDPTDKEGGLTDEQKKAKTEHADYELGNKVVPMRMRNKE